MRGRGTIGLQQNANTVRYQGTHPAAGQPTGAAPALPMQPVVDPIQQLKQLGELRDAGVLSDEEFAAKKADILSRL